MFEIKPFWHLIVSKQKNYTYTKLILKNKTVYMYNNIFGINYLQWLL